MSHPLFFRGVTYFYPVGNTSAVRLTDHLPPEQPANILLLGCGDPRHILYTVYTNESTSNMEPQKLDVTCCDVEAAVLARNALLFTLLADEGALNRLDLIWNIFYHFMLDQESLSLLIEQCRKLVELAEDLETWSAGPYSGFLTACDKKTFKELRQFWGRYIATADYTANRRKQFKENFLSGMKKATRTSVSELNITSARSAGPLLPLALQAVAEQFRKFWSTGLTDDGFHSTDQATFVNPTFAFSMAGEEFAVHYGVDPVAGFHLAEILVSSPDDTPAALVQKLVQAARCQFSRWCTSAIRLLKDARAMPSKLVIRMFVGDALMLCQAFSHLNLSGMTATPVLKAPWSVSRIAFEENQYAGDAATPAPTTFNVIDTSNISDHVGLINLLIATVPLLSKSSSATLCTEALLSYSDTASTTILERLCGDMTTMSLLLGVVPSTFLSRFTARSNIHETLMQAFQSSAPQNQYHERLAWKAITHEQQISFAPDQLSRLLFGIYLHMFSDENMARQLQNMSLSATAHRRAFLEGSLIHYTRRSFVQLLRHIKSRIQADWNLVMEKFDDGVSRDTSLILGSNFYQEMCCYFHLLDIVTFTSMEQSYIERLRNETRNTVFEGWESVPAVVTIVFVIPRSKITAVEAEIRQAGTPVLQCDIRNANFWNAFAHITAAYGRLETTGTGQTKTATIVEDGDGESSSSLVVFFAVSSSSLLLLHNATVGFRTRPSPNTVRGRLAFEAIFSAPLDDPRHVHILVEPPIPHPVYPTMNDLSRVPSGSKQHLSIQMNEACTEIRSFVNRMDITDPTGQALLEAGASVKIKQAPDRSTSLFIDTYSEKVSFPLPVSVSDAKFRVARKSMYIEVIVPPAVSMHIQSEDSITKRFFTMLDDGVPAYWNMHRAHLDSCPLFKPSGNSKSLWLVPHVSGMFSQRERASREMKLATIKDTLLNIKDSLHSLFLYASGIQGPIRSVFALQNTSMKKMLAFIIIAGLRLDVSSHTILADAYVLPATETIQGILHKLVDVVAIKIDPEETEAWRYLLPLFVERCWTWTHRPTCEYLSQGMVPLFPDAGADPEKRPFCSCGVGVGTEMLPQQFKSLSSYVTRAAISPLFAVSYLEKVGPSLDGALTDQEKCRTCGKREGSLSLCARCKKVKYCSKECQVKDWKVHKKNCT